MGFYNKYGKRVKIEMEGTAVEMFLIAFILKC
jgi:hypothetical protein